MENRNIIKIGGILFFIGIILIIASWHYSYPICPLSINEVTFFQFSFLLWPGIIFILLGLFLVGYYCKNKIIIAICVSLFPLLLYVHAFFFYYIPSSDSGAARGMFQVFQRTGIDSNVISYFEFPTYFSLNEITHQITILGEKGIAFIFFTLFGILLGLFLFLFFSNLKNERYIQLSPFLLVIIYFLGIFGFLKYQWVPQTLALVFFFLLLFLSNYMISDLSDTRWKVIFILVFILLVFTHAFISVFFILFFVFLTLKKRYLFHLFLIIISIYTIITVYYTTLNFINYIEAFESFTQQIGGEFASQIPKSLLAKAILFIQDFLIESELILIQSLGLRLVTSKLFCA